MRQVINLETGEITWEEDAPVTPQPPITAYENKNKAMNLLFETDWVNQPDVSDVNFNPHLLNKLEFDSYRQQLRAIAVYPTEGDLVWPTKPIELWSGV